MRLINFLDEASSNLASFEDVKKLCPITSNVKLNLYRGINPSILGNTDYGKIKIPKNRKPRDSSIEFHKLIDSTFKKVLGVAARSNTVFATGNRYVANFYGDLCRIYPSNDFICCWSPEIEDLFLLCNNRLNLSTDSLKAFGVLWAVIAMKSVSFYSLQWKLNALGIIDWAWSEFPDELDKQDIRRGRDREFTKEEVKSFMKKILKTYPNCASDFIKTFYQVGHTIQDLQKAATTKNEVMISGSFYCWEKI